MMLNRSGESEHPYFAPNFRRKTTFDVEYDINFSIVMHSLCGLIPVEPNVFQDTLEEDRNQDPGSSMGT